MNKPQSARLKINAITPFAATRPHGMKPVYFIVKKKGTGAMRIYGLNLKS